MSQAVDVHADLLTGSNIRNQTPLIKALKNAAPKIKDINHNMFQMITARNSHDLISEFYHEHLGFIEQARSHD